MKRKILDILACPECGSDLQLTGFESNYETDENGQSIEDIEEGILKSGCGAVYPIVEGVPRLLEGAFFVHQEFRSRWNKELQQHQVLNNKALMPPSNEFRKIIEPTSKRFEKEWREHPLEERTWGLDQSTRIEHSLRYLGWTRDEIKGKLLLDAGAGTGQLTCTMATLGCEVVGIDLSPAVIRGWKSRDVYAKSRKTSVHIVQGNLMKLPFRKHVFDGVMSHGVLHHTPNTRQAFDVLAPTVRNGGSLGVWLYNEAEGYLPLVPLSMSHRTSVRMSTLRRLTPKLPPSLLYSSLVLYASIFQAFYRVNSVLRKRRHDQTVKERATSLFDSLAPPYVWRHTPREVIDWFTAAGFVEIRETTIPTDVDGFCITGRCQT
jgi:SAM-dependent methyltransferase/uncharacterized protein YbaR (Trm112 family)